MNGSLRLALIVNASLLMADPTLCKVRPEIARAQTLSIRLYDHAEAPAHTLRAAVDQAGYLFRAARIQIIWEHPFPESSEDQGTDMTSAAFQQPDVRGYLVIRLVTGTPAATVPGALGYALPFAHAGAHVLIFYDRAEAVAHNVNEPTYVILGYAIAHEIGHVLLGSSEHGSGGLMQARWTPQTWRLASSGVLAFSRAEAQRMGAGARKLQAPRVLSRQKLKEVPSSSGRHPSE